MLCLLNYGRTFIQYSQQCRVYHTSHKESLLYLTRSIKRFSVVYMPLLTGLVDSPLTELTRVLVICPVIAVVLTVPRVACQIRNGVGKDQLRGHHRMMYQKPSIESRLQTYKHLLSGWCQVGSCRRYTILSEYELVMSYWYNIICIYIYL